MRYDAHGITIWACGEVMQLAAWRFLPGEQQQQACVVVLHGQLNDESRLFQYQTHRCDILALTTNSALRRRFGRGDKPGSRKRKVLPLLPAVTDMSQLPSQMLLGPDFTAPRVKRAAN